MDAKNKKLIQTAAQVMCDSFLDDPMNKVQLEGINHKEKLLQAHARLAIKHASKINGLHLLNNDPRAIMIAFDSNHNRKLLETWTLVKTIGITFFIVRPNEIMRFFRNMKEVVKVLDLKWPKEFVEGRHYRIKVIAVDKALRGTGAFRKLITPAIEYANREQIPMVLETHNPSNVGLYKHFGFMLVKTITSTETPIQQYCMVREPLMVQVPAQQIRIKAKSEKRFELWPRLEMMI